MIKEIKVKTIIIITNKLLDIDNLKIIKYPLNFFYTLNFNFNTFISFLFVWWYVSTLLLIKAKE